MSIPEHLRFHKFKESYFPPSLKMFGLVLGIFGGVLLLKENLVGALPLLVAVFFMIGINGHEFDLKEKTYRHYFGILWLKFGKTININQVKGIVMEKVLLQESMTSRFGKSYKTRVKLWQVYLQLPDGKTCFILETENIKQASSVALIFMTTLQCHVFSKYVNPKRILDYKQLRKGIVKFGDVVFTD